MSKSRPEPAALTPREVLLRYFGELLALNEFAMAEAEAAKTQGREMDLDDLRARRAAIREQYCTQRKRKTDSVVAYGKLDQMAYDPSNLKFERETQESESRVAIEIHNSALHERWKYVLVFQKGSGGGGGGWRIDSLQFRDGRKWRPVPLH